MEKINIAELLRDCPMGMELDCMVYDNVIFENVNDWVYPIRVKTKDGSKSFNLTKYGCTSENENAKCIIFPKGKTTWKGFVPPCKFKDGDIVATNEELQVFILQRAKSNTKGYCYTGYDFECNEFFDAGEWEFDRLATEEEKQKLFDAIKDNGYKWNPETKTLEKLPKFKVGDRIRTKKNASITLSNILITKVKSSSYEGVIGDTTNPAHINFKYQDLYELVPNKFDINTLKPFDQVLVRPDNKHRWSIQFFERLNNVLKDTFVCMGGVRYHQCIPYKGNEYLLDTANDCDDFYKTWRKS